MKTILLIALLSMTISVKSCLIIGIIYYSSRNKTITNYLLTLSYKVSYNSIYYYSKLQLGFMKTKNNITNYIKSTPCLNNLLNYMNQNNDKNICKFTSVNDSLTIYNKYDEDQNLDYKIILDYKLDDEKIKCIEASKVEQADYKFIMTEITINNNNISIHFTKETYNYLIIDNKIDKKFINYFLRTHYADFVKDLSDSEIENYRIKLIDHNVNIVEFDNTKTIKINRNNYILEDN
jgi:hypothetical protein